MGQKLRKCRSLNSLYPVRSLRTTPDQYLDFTLAARSRHAIPLQLVAQRLPCC